MSHEIYMNIIAVISEDGVDTFTLQKRHVHPRTEFEAVEELKSSIFEDIDTGVLYVWPEFNSNIDDTSTECYQYLETIKVGYNNSIERLNLTPQVIRAAQHMLDQDPDCQKDDEVCIRGFEKYSKTISLLN